MSSYTRSRWGAPQGGPWPWEVGDGLAAACRCEQPWRPFAGAAMRGIPGPLEARSRSCGKPWTFRQVSQSSTWQRWGFRRLGHHKQRRHHKQLTTPRLPPPPTHTTNTYTHARARAHARTHARPQYNYMAELKAALDARGHVLLEVRAAGRLPRAVGDPAWRPLRAPPARAPGQGAVWMPPSRASAASPALLTSPRCAGAAPLLRRPDANGHRQDHHAAVTHHQLPAGPPRGAQPA